MGLMDAINPEERINITKSEYYNLVKNSSQLELMIRLISNNTPLKVIKTAFNIAEKE